MNFLPFLVLGAGLWAIINGLLHDIFVVLSEHGKKYDRNLLRLLMDGHILITCGAIQALSYPGIDKHDCWAYFVAGAATLSLLIYCAMIWRFLKSIVTILINAAALTLLIVSFVTK